MTFRNMLRWLKREKKAGNLRRCTIRCNIDIIRLQVNGWDKFFGSCPIVALNGNPLANDYDAMRGEYDQQCSLSQKVRNRIVKAADNYNEADYELMAQALA